MYDHRLKTAAFTTVALMSFAMLAPADAGFVGRDRGRAVAAVAAAPVIAPRAGREGCGLFGWMGRDRGVRGVAGGVAVAATPVAPVRRTIGTAARRGGYQAIRSGR